MKRASHPPNPALVSFLGIAPLVGATSTFAAGCLIGIVMAAGAILAALVGNFARKNFQSRIRGPVMLAFAAFFASCSWLIVEVWSPIVAAGIGLYLPLLAVSSLVAHEMNRSEMNSVKGTRSAVITAIQYLSLALILSSIREIGGAGTFTLPLPGTFPTTLSVIPSAPLPILETPSGSFFALALLAIVNRYLFPSPRAVGAPK